MTATQCPRRKPRSSTHSATRPTSRRRSRALVGARRAADEAGAAAVLLLILTPVLLALGGLVLDGGTGLAARQRTADLAEQAARAGADHLDTNSLRHNMSSSSSAMLDAGAARAAACAYVQAVEPTATCTTSIVSTPSGQQLQVRIRTSTPTVLLGLIGVNTLHTDGSATAQAVTGIRTAALPAPPAAQRRSATRSTAAEGTR